MSERVSRPPTPGGTATLLEEDLGRWADESAGAARVLGGLADRVSTDAAHLTRSVESWTGSAAIAFEALEDRLVGDLAVIGEAIHAAASAYRELSVALSEAVELALQSAAMGHQADDVTRGWQLRREAWLDRDPSDSALQAPPAIDPGSAARRRADQLADEAQRLAALAAAAFAAHLDAAGAVLPTEERRSLTELVSEFGSGMVDSVRDTIWGFSTPRMLLDGEGWRRDVADLARGTVAAVGDPGAALREILDLDTWRESPARAAGRLAPDIIVGALTGGAGAGAGRARTGMRGLNGGRRATGELVESAPSGGAPSFVPPRPDDPSIPIINLTAPGDRMGDNARRIMPIDGHTDVAIHGSPTAFGTTPHGPSVPPSVVADLIRENAKFDGGSVRLVSCRSGASTCGAAGTLADELGVEILAPNTTVWVYPDGRLVVGEGRFSGRMLEITEPGEWIRFTPGER